MKSLAPQVTNQGCLCRRICMFFFVIAQLGVIVYGIAIAFLRLPMATEQCMEDTQDDDNLGHQARQLLHIVTNNTSWPRRWALRNLLGLTKEYGTGESSDSFDVPIVSIVASAAIGIIVAVIYAAFSRWLVPRILKYGRVCVQLGAVMGALGFLIAVPTYIQEGGRWALATAIVHVSFALLIVTYLVFFRDSVRRIADTVHKAALTVIERSTLVQGYLVLCTVPTILVTAPIAIIWGCIWLLPPADGTYAPIPALVNCEEVDPVALGHRVAATVALGVSAIVASSFICICYQGAVTVAISSAPTTLRDAWSSVVRNHLGSAMYATLVTSCMIIYTCGAQVMTVIGAATGDPWNEMKFSFAIMLPAFKILAYIAILRLVLSCYEPAVSAVRGWGSCDTSSQNAIRKTIKLWSTARPRDYLGLIFGSNLALMVAYMLFALLWALCLELGVIGAVQWVAEDGWLQAGEKMSDKLLATLVVSVLFLYMVGLVGVIVSVGAIQAVVPVVFMEDELAYEITADSDVEGACQKPLLNGSQVPDSK